MILQTLKNCDFFFFLIFIWQMELSSFNNERPIQMRFNFLCSTGAYLYWFRSRVKEIGTPKNKEVNTNLKRIKKESLGVRTYIDISFNLKVHFLTIFSTKLVIDFDFIAMGRKARESYNFVWWKFGLDILGNLIEYLRTQLQRAKSSSCMYSITDSCSSHTELWQI